VRQAAAPDGGRPLVATLRRTEQGPEMTIR
jgi:hypothetical protein